MMDSTVTEIKGIYSLFMTLRLTNGKDIVKIHSRCETSQVS